MNIYDKHYRESLECVLYCDIASIFETKCDDNCEGAMLYLTDCGYLFKLPTKDEALFVHHTGEGWIFGLAHNHVMAAFNFRTPDLPEAAPRDGVKMRVRLSEMVHSIMNRSIPEMSEHFQRRDASKLRKVTLPLLFPVSKWGLTEWQTKPEVTIQ